LIRLRDGVVRESRLFEHERVVCRDCRIA
jgi:hypothetical protein